MPYLNDINQTDSFSNLTPIEDSSAAEIEMQLNAIKKDNAPAIEAAYSID